MKHDWECIREPYVDKIADQDWQTRADAISVNQFTYKNERTVLMPGVFACRNCGYIQRCNYPPPESWSGVVGDIPFCDIEIAQTVQEG